MHCKVYFPDIYNVFSSRDYVHSGRKGQTTCRSNNYGVSRQITSWCRGKLWRGVVTNCGMSGQPLRRVVANYGVSGQQLRRVGANYSVSRHITACQGNNYGGWCKLRSVWSILQRVGATACRGKLRFVGPNYGMSGQYYGVPMQISACWGTNNGVLRQITACRGKNYAMSRQITACQGNYYVLRKIITFYNKLPKLSHSAGNLTCAGGLFRSGKFFRAFKLPALAGLSAQPELSAQRPPVSSGIPGSIHPDSGTQPARLPRVSPATQLISVFTTSPIPHSERISAPLLRTHG